MIRKFPNLNGVLCCAPPHTGVQGVHLTDMVEEQEEQEEEEECGSVQSDAGE